MLTAAIQEQIVTTLQARYGTWSGFQAPAFVHEETEYKRKVIAEAGPLLDRAELRKLLDAAQYKEFLERIENAAKKHNNLLYLSTPKSGDLRVVKRLTESERAGICTAFYDLLYGEGSSPERLGRYLAYIKAAGLPNYWTFPTYFLFVTDPAHDLFIKPTKVEAFFKAVHLPDLWQPTPSAQAYAAMTEFAQELRQGLSNYHPQDMVDIQSAMYVVGNAYPAKPAGGTQKAKLAYPFTQLFASYDDACAAFDLLRLAFEYLGVESESDERFALTIPKSDGRRVLRLNYGNWATIGIYGPQSPKGCILSMSLQQGIPGMECSATGFDQKPGEMPIRFYDLPFAAMLAQLRGLRPERLRRASALSANALPTANAVPTGLPTCPSSQPQSSIPNSGTSCSRPASRKITLTPANLSSQSGQLSCWPVWRSTPS